MDQRHKFRVVAWWSSGQNGIAKSDSAPNAIHFTAPVAIGGSEGRWTPEDLLLCAIASGLTTTCRDLAERSMLEYSDLQVEVEGVVSSSSSGSRFEEVIIRAELTVPREEEQALALNLLRKAKAECLISRVLGIQQTLQPVVTVNAPVSLV